MVGTCCGSACNDAGVLGRRGLHSGRTTGGLGTKNGYWPIVSH
jgi:hypothetical protein